MTHGRSVRQTLERGALDTSVCVRGALSPEFHTEFDHNYRSRKHPELAVGRLAPRDRERKGKRETIKGKEICLCIIM